MLKAGVHDLAATGETYVREVSLAVRAKDLGAERAMDLTACILIEIADCGGVTASFVKPGTFFFGEAQTLCPSL